jgi:NAD(P)-dependent dehydrogenase (short-subunit alcohol dehydrogenase family)
MSDPLVVLVTGASSGIGRACAARLARSGCRVFGMARTVPPTHDGRFLFLPGDVRDDVSVRECVSLVLREAERIDVLVNCAGIVVAGPAEEMLTDEIMDQVQTNLLGTMRMCRAVLPAMRVRHGGRIITVGSLAGLMGWPFQSVYSASKYGIEGYSESLQMEVEGFGIRVVVVDPGDIATEITSHRKKTRGMGNDSPYRLSFDSAMRSQAASEQHGWNVERLARFIERIVRSRSPRFRYTPGPFIERISPAARRLIPDRLYLKIVARFGGARRHPARTDFDY